MGSVEYFARDHAGVLPNVVPVEDTASERVLCEQLTGINTSVDKTKYNDDVVDDDDYFLTENDQDETCV